MAPIPKVNPLHRSKNADKLTPEQFRARVWERDHGRDRATGQVVYRTHYNSQRRGQVCHLFGRRVMPKWATEPARALLMSDYHHQLSDARGGNLLKLTDPETGDRAEDATKKIRFTLYDREGRVVWTRVS